MTAIKTHIRNFSDYSSCSSQENPRKRAPRLDARYLTPADFQNTEKVEIASQLCSNEAFEQMQKPNAFIRVLKDAAISHFLV